MLKMRPKFKTSAPFTETKGLHFQFTKNPYVFFNIFGCLVVQECVERKEMLH